MKEEEEIKIDHLNSQNQLFLSLDYLEILSQSILKNNPNEKWLNIAKELSSVCMTIAQSKKFYSRVFQELEYQAELNFIVKQYGHKKVLAIYFNHLKLEKENERLKKEIQELLEK